MSPFFTVLTQWVEAMANGAADLDPLTRARLDKLAGRSIAVDMDPPGEAATLHFEDGAIRLEPGIPAAPSAIVRGSPAVLGEAFFGATKPRGGIVVEGDEHILTELRSIVRDFHPESLSPLDQLVGPRTAQAITAVVELGIAAVAAVARNVGEEGGRLVRAGARQRYLGVRDFEAMLASAQALRLRLDRLNARADVIERSRGRRE